MADLAYAGPRAFGGGPLKGDRWVRIIYLDESGTSSIDQDPFLVVAGIILDGDRQWLALERYYRSIADQFLPAQDRGNVIFHAKDIFHGSKYFHRDKGWHENLRYELLDELAKIPKDFDFPIVCAAVDRREVAEKHPEQSPENQRKHAYLVATTVCLCQAEKYMRTRDSGEVASLLFEDTHGVRQHVKYLHRFLRSPGVEFMRDGSNDADFLPLTKIIDTPNFAEKNESSPLQAADFCAFAIKRQKTKAKYWDRFYEPIKPYFVMIPRDEA